VPNRIRYHQALSDLMVPHHEVKPDPLNPNNGDVEALIESITASGCYRPIYASRETKRIVGGHHLYAALLEMGATDIPVLWLDGDDAAARRILAADNQIARLAKMDDAQLLALLNTIRESDLGLFGTGYTQRMYEAIARDPVPYVPPERLPAVQDIYLGIHHTCPNCGHEWSD